MPDTGPGALTDAVERVLAADETILTRQRKGRDVTDDVRPYVQHLSVGDQGRTGTTLHADLRTQPRGLRPAEVLAVLGDDLREGLVCRTHQWIEHGGDRWEPLPAEATSAPHAEARAS